MCLAIRYGNYAFKVEYAEWFLFAGDSSTESLFARELKKLGSSKIGCHGFSNVAALLHFDGTICRGTWP